MMITLRTLRPMAFCLLTLTACSSVATNNVIKIKPGEARGWRVETESGRLDVVSMYGSRLLIHFHLPDGSAEPTTVELGPYEERSIDLAPNQIFFFENPTDQPARLQYRIGSSGEMGVFQVRVPPAGGTS